MKKMFSKRALKIVFIIGVLCMFANSSIFAKLTEYNNVTNDVNLDNITKIVQEVLKVGMNFSLASISALLSALALLLWLVLQVLFVGYNVTGNMLQIPFPDTIIFNKMALFDANFINPDPASPLYSIKSIAAGIYQSFVIIAITSFVILAMVVGIKLALSTIASERAQYKKTVSAWLTGIVLLLSLKWIIAGLFVINETIVQAIYDLATETNWAFEVFSLASIPLIGSTLQQIMSWFGGAATAVSWGSVPGYLGMVLKYMLEGIGGNFIGSLIAFVVMGQTISIIVSYIKRVFYCLLLGLVGPLIIVVDTLNRSMGKNSQIFNNWLKQLSLSILMQSFHAVFMYIIIKMIIEIGAAMTNQAMAGLIIIVLTAGLIKFEKLFKQLFGMGDSIAGDLKGSADKAFAKIGAGVTAAKALADNGKKLKENRERKVQLLEQRAALRGRTMSNEGGGVNSRTSSTNVINNATTNNQDGQSAKNFTSNSQNVQSTNSKNSLGGGDDVKTLLTDIRNQLAQKNQKDNEKELRLIEKELGEVEGKIASATLAKKLTPVNALAGLAVGIGADNSALGATLTTALDAAAEKIGKAGADRTRQELYEQAKAEGRDNPDILRNGGKTISQTIKQEIKNTITLKDVRDISSILSGKYNSDTNYNPVNNVEDIE